MKNVHVRVATESDVPLLARFRYELRSSNPAVESEDEFIKRCTAWMRDRLCTGSSWKCWIADYDEEMVGNAWAQLIEKIPNPGSEGEHYAYLTNFYVREKYRSRGIGSSLLSAVLDWAKDNDVHTIILWPRERSKPLYSRHGFSEADDLMQLTIKSESSIRHD